MHGDFSRWTHDPRKHYTGVLEQQGRVRVDADFNELVAILQHLRRTATRDVIGGTGVPLEGGGFEVTPSAAGDGSVELAISSGRIYVDGILCELDDAAAVAAPPLDATAPDGSERHDLVYLDVWQRHVTALEDPELREVALGGPDTTTRLETVCQVKVLADLPPAQATCGAPLPAEVTAASGGRLTTHLEAAAPPDDPCVIAPGGGYSGIENRLYRVEIHRGGDLSAGDRARFKWSRDNGAVVYPIASFQNLGGVTDRVVVEELGRDEVLALRENDWVEVLGDETELAGASGTLVQITGIDRARRIITLGADVAAHAAEGHPKLRRWDGAGDGQGLEVSGDEVELEDGIKVSFGIAPGGGRFHVRDYWLFAARTVTREVESLLDAPPHGIEHHYAALAAVHWSRSGGEWVAEDACDCRRPFAPLAAQGNLLHAGGDGQEAMDGQELCHPLRVRAVNGGAPVEGATVRFAIVQPAAGDGVLIEEPGPGASGASIEVLTDAEGLAACRWQLDSRPAQVCQRVEATLLDCDGAAVQPPLEFDVKLSIASEVANHSACPIIEAEPTVQAALDRLCDNAALYLVGGDGQEARPGAAVCRPLEVRLANGRHPVANAAVEFEIVEGAGTLFAGGGSGASVEVTTDAEGLAACQWVLGPSERCQRVEARHTGPLGPPPVPPVHFNASLSLASEVFYDTEQCPAMQGSQIDTVQGAIDFLCQRERGGCAVTVGEGGRFPDLRAAFGELLGREDDICICLLPGDHDASGLTLEAPAGRRLRIAIGGCGEGTRLRLERAGLGAAGLDAFALRELSIEARGLDDAILLKRCRSVALRSCRLSQTTAFAGRLLTVSEAEQVDIEGCAFDSWLDLRSLLGVDTIAGLALPPSPRPGSPVELHASIEAATRTLAAAEPNQRAAVVERLAAVLPASARPVLEELASVDATGPIGVRETSALRAAVTRLISGVAIAFLDGGGAVSLRHSRLAGELRLFGVEGALTDDSLLSDLAPQIRKSFSGGDLALSDDDLFWITVDQALAAAIGAGVEPVLFGRCQLAQSRVARPGNLLLADHVAVSSNDWSGGALIATALGSTAIFVGNRAGQAQVRSLTDQRADAANLGIAFV